MSVAATAASTFRPTTDVRPHLRVWTDRRARARLPFAGEVAIGSDSGFCVASAVDISSNGVRIASRRPLRVGARVSLQIVLPGDAVLARGIVRWAESDGDAPFGTGIEIDVLGDVDRRALDNFLRTLLGR